MNNVQAASKDLTYCEGTKVWLHSGSANLGNWNQGVSAVYQMWKPLTNNDLTDGD